MEILVLTEFIGKILSNNYIKDFLDREIKDKDSDKGLKREHVGGHMSLIDCVVDRHSNIPGSQNVRQLQIYI